MHYAGIRPEFKISSVLWKLPLTQRAQYGLIKEYTSDRVMDPYLVQAMFLNLAILGFWPQAAVDWAVWESCSSQIPEARALEALPWA